MVQRARVRKTTRAAFARYLARRAFLSVLVIVGVVVIVFFLSRVVPADPALLWAGPHARPEQIERAREELHLNDPVPVQFYHYMAGLLTGSLGVSIRTQEPVIEDLAATLPATLELIVASLVIALLVGIPLGVISGIRRGKWEDHASRVVAIGGVSLPSFWLAVLLQLVFVSTLGLLPISGRFTESLFLANPVRRVTGFLLLDALIQGNVAVFADGLWHLLLPAATLAAYPVGLVARMVRTQMIEVLGENYIRTARAYGLSARLVHYHYALRNAIAPAVVALGLSFAYSLTGAFLIEYIFVWPGIGQYAYLSTISFDYPAILGVAIVVSGFYVIVNLVVDMVQSFLDPRVILGKKEA